MAEELVGMVTHYFKGPGVAVVKLAEGELAVGDTVRFRGHTSDFTERIASMEVEHEKIERAGKGDEVAIKVDARVRPHDEVFKVHPE